MSIEMNPCEQLKQTLVDAGFEAVAQDPNLSVHVESCDHCRGLMSAWQQIPDLLAELPETEPAEQILRRASTTLAAARAISQPRRYLAPTLASAAVLLACIGLSSVMLREDALRHPAAPQLGDSSASVADADQVGFESALRKQNKDKSMLEQQASEPARSADQPASAALDEAEEKAKPGNFGGLMRHRGDASGTLAAAPAAPETDDDLATELSTVIVTGTRAQSQTITAASPVTEVSREDLKYFASKSRESETDLGRSLPADGLEPVSARAVDGPGESIRPASGVEPNKRQRTENGAFADLYSKREVAESIDQLRSNERLGDSVAAANAPVDPGRFAGGVEPAKIVGGYARSAAKGDALMAFDLLQGYQAIDGVQTQPATGYWANTYLPGDLQIRALSARLANSDRAWLKGTTTLEQGVRPVLQPFDAPADNALALTVMADANALNDPARMRVQVGIRGIEHRAGQRPPMSLGIVVDLPEQGADELRIASRALIEALLQSKQAGDQFSLVVTGQTHSAVVEAKDFRFGPLQLAQQVIAGTADQTDTPEPLDLHAAMRLAGTMVQQNDDPSRPLGSSAVLLIAGRDIDDLQRLTALAHDRAKAGITLSVVALGGDSVSAQAEELALAGLGTRRFLSAASQARQLVEEELHASSRAVARAARLSIRLAPGVRLVSVLGSQRLDDPQSQRVREIERSMDQRLSANLGIDADRGEDEGGIQVVIPSIFAGDSIALLLDVIVERPGPIADVSLRYKDLVFLRNGSLHNHLSLPEGELKRGPRELSVLKNLLTHDFVEAIGAAALALGSGQLDEAVSGLHQMRATIDSARAAIPAWSDDPDLIRDQQLLERYLDALAESAEQAQQSFLADSMRYAAWAKTHRAIKEWKP